MPNDTKTPAPCGRKPYVAPVLKKVALRAEEAVLSNCKTSGSNGVSSPCLIGITACVSLTS